jgi:hypothetical protein
LTNKGRFILCNGLTLCVDFLLPLRIGFPPFATAGRYVIDFVLAFFGMDDCSAILPQKVTKTERSELINTIENKRDVNKLAAWIFRYKGSASHCKPQNFPGGIKSDTEVPAEGLTELPSEPDRP